MRRHSSNPLQELELFAAASRDQLDAARSQLTLLTIPAGVVVMVEGTPGFEFLIIDEGQVTVTTGPPWQPETLAILGRGDIVGEMALLGDSLRSATVTTDTTVSAYVGHLGEFSALLQDVPSFRARVTSIGLRRADTRVPVASRAA
jgi:protein lysine acetyltransferase